MSDENTISKTETDNLKSQEITFDSFIELIKSAIVLVEAKAISQSFQLIKKGYSGDFNKEQVDLTFNSIKDWKFIDLFALKLINEERNGKLSSFAKQLIGRIRFHFIQELKYPLPANSTIASRDEIFDWIKNSFQSFSPENIEKTKSQTEISGKLPPFYTLDKFLRKAFVCLSNNSKEEFIIEAIDSLLTQYLSKTGKKFKLSKIAYINSVTKALTSKTAHIVVENILVSSSPFKEFATEAKESENELWRKYQILQAKVSQLEANEKSLITKLHEANKKNEEVSSQLGDKNRALEEWKRENKALDQHWREVTQEHLTKQANDTKRKIQHDIDGIRLSLENSPPDSEIALMLLQRIEKILGENTQNAK